MYKDKDKQREADRARQKKRRDKIKAKGVTDVLEAVAVGVTQGVTMTKADSHIDASDIGVVKALHRAISNPRRGRDIKCFEDLPPDVQQAIERTSDSPEERRQRTAIAVSYQHTFPDRYEPVSDTDFACLMATAGKTKTRPSLPGDDDYDGVCLGDKYKDRWIGTAADIA